MVGKHQFGGGSAVKQPEDASSGGCESCFSILLKLSVVVVVVILLMLLNLPEPSTVALKSITVPVFKVNLTYPEVRTYSKWEIQLMISNHDSRWKARYEGVTCILYKKEAGGLRRVGSSPVGAFGLGRREKRAVTVKMAVRENRSVHRWEFTRFSVRVTGSVGYERAYLRLMERQSVDTTCSDVTMEFKSKAGWWYQSEPELCDGVLVPEQLVQEVDHRGGHDVDLRIN